ncbi:VOC family protein [Homoserinibacter sp. GY 40078]|uniref:VOC family protein n=1 Tax=Homoserinibacter sp. GY 40078 TaxID=2603275 RepID=UPI0011CC5D96|nr:VOC family protein [Homoserinibacter sp. GY 40078]TXK17762.1 VOC family protein [Homoserinibacter sp. GY 40078]
MSITTTTHLNFRGNARQALEFYQSVFGGQLIAATYADLGMPADAPGADKIVFAELRSDEGFHIMAYDVPGQDDSDPAAIAGTTTRANGATITDRTFFLSVRGESLAEVDGYWQLLAVDAEIVEPLAASPWSPGFGMLTDRFGVTWLLDVQASAA